jgi:hypothetical protein
MQLDKRMLLVAVLALPPFTLSPTAQAHKRNPLVSASEIAHAVAGRTCTTAAGATFDFGKHGEYAYSGLWKSDGHYKVSAGIITVAFHSGLVRSFAVSIRSGMLVLENTVVVCKRSTVARLVPTA